MEKNNKDESHKKKESNNKIIKYLKYFLKVFGSWLDFILSLIGFHINGYLFDILKLFCEVDSCSHQTYSRHLKNEEK